MGINNFNRVINVKLFRNEMVYKRDADTEKEVLDAYIKCPATGRKPNIEIQGTMYESDIMTGLQVKIRNLYLDYMTNKNYKRIEIEAGYQNEITSTFIGDIYLIYQEAPGPESVVSISCLSGSVSNFLNTALKFELPVNFSLKDAITKIAEALDFQAENIPQVTCAEKWSFNGIAKDALVELKKRFPDVKIFINGKSIKCVHKDNVDTSVTKEIKFLSAPPQLVGNEDTKGLATITAPWNPAILPGDVVRFSTKYYAARKISGSAGDDTRMLVVSIQLQFSTTGSANKMVLMGTIV